MSVKYVRIYYGPCQTISQEYEHIPGKLSGLRNRLRRHGFRVDIIPVSYTNYCMVQMCGYEIFRCNQKHLSYNMTSQRDVVSRRAVQAALEASQDFVRARTYLYTWKQLDEQMFKRSEFAPKDHWAFDVDLEPIEVCVGCEDCYKFIQEKLQPYVEEDKRKAEMEIYVRENVLKPYEEEKAPIEKVQL